MKAAFSIGGGVTLLFEIETEPKHFSDEDRDEALERFAKKLGAEYLYVFHEEVRNENMD